VHIVSLLPDPVVITYLRGLPSAEGKVIRKIEVHAKSEGVIRIEAASAPLEVVVNDGSVPESDMSNNAYKIEVPEKSN